MLIRDTGSPWVWFCRRGRVPEKKQPKIFGGQYISQDGQDHPAVANNPQISMA